MVTFSTKVKDLPFKNGFIPYKDKTEIDGLICSTGRINQYRMAFIQGRGASTKDKTFDRSIGKRGGHKCCGSQVVWRHRAGCKYDLRTAPDDYSDLKGNF